MIVGNGLIASAFINYEDRDDIIIFASGVSNSKETLDSAYKREEKLLQKYINKKKKLVYFSTTSIYDKELSNTKYVHHKLRMENLVSQNCSKYLIIRTSNILGPKGNKATIINFLIDKIQKGEKFELWNKAKRNILDIEDFGVVCNLILQKEVNNKIVNVCNFKNISVLEIVDKIEQKLKKKGVYIMLPQGGEVIIENDFVKNILSDEMIEKLNSPDYFTNLLKKYYG